MNYINPTAGIQHNTILDLKEKHFQMEIEEDHKQQAAFEFEHKLYKWNGMVMVYKMLQ